MARTWIYQPSLERILTLISKDGHVRVLPTHVANKIAAGEVVERPASVVKELIENAIDAGSKRIAVAIVQGGRKLISVQDDGCGMTKDDAILCLERQATSKILDVDDIEKIDTLGFRGEAIPSIASVSRFTLTTRRAQDDEGTRVQVNAGIIAQVGSAGCPPGTLVEVRDLFCNVPARRKFLRSYATEEAHIKQIFTVNALAHPQVGFSLCVDNREIYRLSPNATSIERIRELLGDEFIENALPINADETNAIRVFGHIEKPNLSMPTRREQYIFINGRPATAPTIAYALREAYPHRAGDSRPAIVLFIDLPPNQVDVNVHPTKREVRFRDNQGVKNAITKAVLSALSMPPPTPAPSNIPQRPIECPPSSPIPVQASPSVTVVSPPPPLSPELTPEPIAIEFSVEPDSTRSQPWKWFKFLAQSNSGYLLIETDAGIVTINPQAARERIAYERMLAGNTGSSQALLIPETVHLSPVDAARISETLPVIRSMGFQIEKFGNDTFKIDAVPQLIGNLSPVKILSTLAKDLSEGGLRRGRERWREELTAKSIARSFAGMSLAMTPEGATKLVEELCTCSMPYVCPRGKPVMIFTSTRELERKFSR